MNSRQTYCLISGGACTFICPWNSYEVYFHRFI